MLEPSSQKNLAQAHPLLQKLINTVVKENPNLKFRIVDALRGKVAQEAAFASHHSLAHFGQSAHNYIPAIALDIYPLPIQYSDLKPYKALSTIILATAKKLGIPLVWGGNWKSIKDHPHYELNPWRSFAAKAKLYNGSL